MRGLGFMRGNVPGRPSRRELLKNAALAAIGAGLLAQSRSMKTATEHSEILAFVGTYDSTQEIGFCAALLLISTTPQRDDL